MAKRLVLAVVVILLLGIVSIEAVAAGPEGTITIRLAAEGVPVSGGTVALYRVGKLKADGSGFLPWGAFENCGIAFEEIRLAKLAEPLAEYVEAENLAGTVQALDKEGRVVFTNLEQGLYLMVQEEAAEGYRKFSPFLISVPTSINGELIYKVDASPKVQISKLEPDLPQTGQLNWPVPVLSGLGLCFMGLGLALRGKKKDSGGS